MKTTTAIRKSHVFAVPVVREMARPSTEPASWADCW
jgi:hypothetical protein